MQKLRDIETAEIEAIRRFLAAETKQYRIGFFACAGGAVVLASLSLWEALGFGNQGTEVLQVAAGGMSLVLAGVAYFFRRQAVSFEYEFSPVRELTGEFVHRRAGSPRYTYPVYYVAGQLILIPSAWETETRFENGQSITVHLTEVTNRRDGQAVRFRRFVIEIPETGKITERGWL